MADEFISWFTGFWEGEGTIHIKFWNSERVKYVNLSIGQAGDRGKEVLSYIRDKWGLGGVRQRKNKKDDGYKRQFFWIWRVSDTRGAIKILETILPHLKARKVEVEEALTKLRKADLNRLHHPWSDFDIEFLKENYGKIPTKEIARILGEHTVSSIWTKARKLGLRLGKGYWKLSQNKRCS